MEQALFYTKKKWNTQLFVHWLDVKIQLLLCCELDPACITILNRV